MHPYARRATVNERRGRIRTLFRPVGTQYGECVEHRPEVAADRIRQQRQHGVNRVHINTDTPAMLVTLRERETQLATLTLRQSGGHDAPPGNNVNAESATTFA